MAVANPFSDLRSWSRDQVEQVSKKWWVLLITGLVSLAAGGIIIANNWTVTDLAVFISVLLIFQGFFTLFGSPIDGSARTWSIVVGLVEIGTGIAIWVWPGQTLLVVAFFIGWLLLFRGIMAITGSISARHVMPYWGWMLVLGIVEVLVAFYLLSRPALTLVAAVLAIGLVAMFYGVMEIVLAFEVKNLPKRFDDVTASFKSDGDSQRRLESTSA